MALTVAYDVPNAERISRNLAILTGTIAFDSSYPTGGEDISAIFKKFKSVKFISFSPTAGYVFDTDETSGSEKVLAYYVDNNAAADSAMIQIPDTTDLSAITDVNFIVIGTV